MKYLVTIADREVEVVVDGEQLTVDGVAVAATLERIPGSPEVRVVIDGQAHRLAVDAQEGGMWRLVDRGAVTEVGIEDERTRHIRSLTGAGKASAGGGILKAPMPGLVVRIAVAVGDQVGAGAGLVVLEAMKMENELKAPAAGVVTAIKVTPGQAVEKGAVLLELAPPS